MIECIVACRGGGPEALTRPGNFSLFFSTVLNSSQQLNQPPGSPFCTPCRLQDLRIRVALGFQALFFPSHCKTRGAAACHERHSPPRVCFSSDATNYSKETKAFRDSGATPQRDARSRIACKIPGQDPQAAAPERQPAAGPRQSHRCPLTTTLRGGLLPSTKCMANL